MKIKIFDLENKKDWDSALRNLPPQSQDIYYTPGYFELYADDRDNAKCFSFEADGNSAVYPFVMRPLSQLGLLNFSEEHYDIEGIYGYNGVAASSNDEKFVNAFYAAFSEYCSEAKVVAEFTRFHPVLKNKNFSVAHMNVIDDRETVVVDLSCDYDSIWEKSYDSRARNMIRKAQKNNLRAAISHELDDYIRFHEIYTHTMQNLSADDFYFFDKSYFINVFEKMKDSSCIINVYSDDELAASVLMLFHGIYAHYHLSARNEKYSNLGAGNLALDAGIRYSLENKYRILHLGGGHTGGTDSLMKFKASFSKDRALFSIGKKIHDREVYDALCSAWELKYPEKKELYSKLLLKYRK